MTAWRVGQEVYDTARGERAVVTDIRTNGLPRPVYVLRHPLVMWAQWEVTDPGSLRAVTGADG